jgi:site-specific recombinase XerD
MVARCTQFILARGQIIQAERRFRSQLFSAEKFDVIKLSRLVNQVATHSLRKSAARQFLEASGNDMSKTAAFLGHRNPATTSAYILHDGFELFQTMQLMGDAMFANVA